MASRLKELYDIFGWITEPVLQQGLLFGLIVDSSHEVCTDEYAATVIQRDVLPGIVHLVSLSLILLLLFCEQKGSLFWSPKEVRAKESRLKCETCQNSKLFEQNDTSCILLVLLKCEIAVLHVKDWNMAINTDRYGPHHEIV
jgi:hypothetical protein